MVDIALVNLTDAAAAKDILERGLAVLTVESGRKVLQQSFDEKVEKVPEKNIS
jgi:hypothetical protein